MAETDSPTPGPATTPAFGHPDAQRPGGHTGTPEERLEAALTALGAGEPVVVLEDVGTGTGAAALVAAAAGLRPATLAFVIRNSSGIVCAAMPADRLDQLRIPAQFGAEPRSGRPELAVAVDLREGITTGISASDRARTLRALADPRTIPDDLVRPGHILPVRCEPGGVLDQSCVEQAALDLCRLAEVAACAVVTPVASESDESDHAVALRLAADHQLAWVGADELARHRRHTELHVGQTASVALPTRYGTFQAMCFGYDRDGTDHLVLCLGDPVGEDVLVRVHLECVTGDVLGSLGCRCASALDASLRLIADTGRGVLIYLRERPRAGLGMTHIVDGCGARDERDETIAAHILRDLGINSVTVLSDDPNGTVGPTGYGVTVNRRLPIIDQD